MKFLIVLAISFLVTTTVVGAAGILVTPTGNSATVQRTVIGSGHVSATDGNGVSGDMTLSLSDVPTLVPGWYTNVFLYVDAKGILTNVTDNTSNLTAYITSLLGKQTTLYFRAGLTNTEYGSNATYQMTTDFNSTGTSNTSYPMTNGEYAAVFQSTTNLVTAISPGSAIIDFDANVSGTGGPGGTITPEFYLFTNGVFYKEFADANSVVLTTTRAHYRSVIVITTNAPIFPETELAVRFKASGVSGNGTRLHIYTGSNAVSGISLPAILSGQAVGASNYTVVQANTVIVGTTNIHTLISAKITAEAGGGSTQMIAAAIGSLMTTNATTNHAGIYWTNLVVASPGGNPPGIFILGNTNLIFTNGLGMISMSTNGKVGIGKITPSTFMLDVAGNIGGSAYSASGNYNAPQSGNYGFSFVNESTLMCPGNNTLSFVGVNANEFEYIVLGTNSIAAPASGATNAAPTIGKARAFGGAHVPGIKLDSNGSTNGCFLEIRGLPATSTNIAPGSGCIIIFATTNGTSDGKAVSWVVQENGTMTQFSPHAGDAPAEFYMVTNWVKGIEPKISKSMNIYTGTIEWQNDSLRALMLEWLADGQDVTKLGLKGALHRIETFAQYTERTGTPMSTRDWDLDQNTLQAKYDAERSEQVAALAKAQADKVLDPKVSDDVYVKPIQDIRKPKSPFMLQTP